MRVMVVGGLSGSLINFRGPLLRTMVAGGPEVLTSASPAPPEVVKTLSDWGISFHPIPLARAGLNSMGDLRTLLAMRRLIQQEKPDRILAYTAKPVIYSCLAARAFDQTQVYAMITGLGYAFGTGGWQQQLVGTGVQMLYRWALRHAAGVLFQNPDDRDLFKESRLVPAHVPVRVINGSGVDLEYFMPKPLPPCQVFLLMARLLADKGVREYHEAARRVKQQYPQARFQLAGNIDSNPASISTGELQKWEKEGVVEYLGQLEDVRPALAETRVYVLPSYREGTPRSVLEAMATGRPIITTDAPGCRETVVEGVNGYLVPPRNVDALAAAMIRMIEAPQIEIQRMADASLAIVRDRYDVNKVNTDILDFMGLG